VYLAGVQMRPKDVLELIRRLRDARLDPTAERLEAALLVRTLQFDLRQVDRDAILHVTQDRRPEFAALRIELLQESVRQAS
jgi:hypothetical protein